METILLCFEGFWTNSESYMQYGTSGGYY